MSGGRIGSGRWDRKRLERLRRGRGRSSGRNRRGRERGASRFALSRAGAAGLAAPPANRAQRLDHGRVGDRSSGDRRRRRHGPDVGGQRRRGERGRVKLRLPARRDAVVVKTVLERNGPNGDRERDAQHREQADFGRRGRRRQVAPTVVFDVTVLLRRRRRRRAEIVKRVIRAVVVDEFIGRWRRKVFEGLGAKVRRRFELG
jgi:hypothetical protein